MKLSKILEKEKITVDENVHDVLQYGEIDLDNIDNPKEFNRHDFVADDFTSEYGTSYVDYDVFKDSVQICYNISETDLIEFFEKLVREYENK